MNLFRIVLYAYLFILFLSFMTVGSAPLTRSKNLPKDVPQDLEMVFFENGVGGFWATPSATETENNIILCFGPLGEFMEQYQNLRQIEKLFPTYNVLYFEYPGVGISDSSRDFLQELFLAYQAILRHKKWKKIGFIGIEYGAIIQSEIYNESIKNAFRKPDWIVQINGFASSDNYSLFHIPWCLQFFIKKKKMETEENYKNIKIPLLLFHSKNNKTVPFVESVNLYFKLKSKCVFVPLFGHYEMTLLSKENIEIIKEKIATYIDVAPSAAIM